jgi:nitrite reductase (NO-forming)
MTNFRKKPARAFFTSIFLLFSVVLTPYSTDACEYCNNAFRHELTEGARKNSLVAKELLLAMYNQQQSSAAASAVPPQREFIEIMNRDAGLSLPATGYVPQNTPPTVTVSIELAEGEVYMGNGVMYKGFTTNGTIPGPTIIVEEGDIVEFRVVNKGTVPHGASIHSAYTQTSKYLGKIPPGVTARMVFKVNHPGVYLYHCAPGGHAIPMHIIFGQYGMMVVKPKKKYKLEQILNKPPDLEIYLTQHEWYANGKDAIDSKPMYTTFNGKIFRYVEEPLQAKPGDYVRMHFLNAGPNLISTLHIVGIIWDYVYWQGNPDVVFPGGQSVLAGPTDSWTIEFRMPPDEGAYTLLSHAVGSTDRGAIGLIICDRNAPTPTTVYSDGPVYTSEEMNEFKTNSLRTISPFEPGSMDVDRPVEYGPETKEVTIQIIGNSFYPKRVSIAAGTTIRWINEDVFAYLEGEYSGIHNVVATEGPVTWTSPMLAHAENFHFTFDRTGEYKYLCTPHPYMKGEIIVVDKGRPMQMGDSTFNYVIILLAIILLVLVAILFIAILK